LGISAIACAAKLANAIHSAEFSKRNDAFEVPTPSISSPMIKKGGDQRKYYFELVSRTTEEVWKFVHNQSDIQP